jgi:hypothetical protein
VYAVVKNIIKSSGDSFLSDNSLTLMNNIDHIKYTYPQNQRMINSFNRYMYYMCMHIKLFIIFILLLKLFLQQRDNLENLNNLGMAEGGSGSISTIKNEASAEASAVEITPTPRLPPKFIRQFSNALVCEAIKDNLIVKSGDELCFRKGECFQILDDSEVRYC